MENKHTDEKSIALRSSAVQEILGLVPNWMIRCGNTLILFLIIGVFTISYFIKYPNTVTCEVALSTTVPTENLYADIDGTFLKLNIQDGDRVNSGDLLGMITNDGADMMLTSNMSGQIHFIDFWKIGRHVKQGDLLFTIMPTNHGPYIGKLKVPINQIAKIRKGQQVRIYLSEDIILKNDIIESTIQRIGTVPDQDGFLSVEVKIGERLATISDKEISYMPGTTGKAEIIVEDLRLIERFFYQLRNIFNM